MRPAESQTVRLRDGRTLGFAEYGNAGGSPLFYFHGHPAARFEAGLLDDAAAQAGIRLIAVDRPGMGLSTHKADRRLLDWPDDVAELADHLRFDRFGVVGFSGGGPYALACAYRIPHRLVACGTIAGLGRTGPFIAFLSTWAPAMVMPVARRFFGDVPSARKSLRRLATGWTASDRQAISAASVMESVAASMAEALSQGIEGAVCDGGLLGQDWGFDPAAIAYSGVRLWHGDDDRLVPSAMTRAMVDRLPRSTATYHPEEGHLSLLVNRGGEVMAAMAADFAALV